MRKMRKMRKMRPIIMLLAVIIALSCAEHITCRPISASARGMEVNYVITRGVCGKGWNLAIYDKNGQHIVEYYMPWKPKVKIKRASRLDKALYSKGAKNHTIVITYSTGHVKTKNKKGINDFTKETMDYKKVKGARRGSKIKSYCVWPPYSKKQKEWIHYLVKR